MGVVEVRIPRAEVERFDNAVLRGQVVINRLREAGVPVVGVLFPEGVERGRLTQWTDDMFDQFVYEWSE